MHATFHSLALALAWTSLSLTAAEDFNTWSRYAEGSPGERTGSALLFAPEAGRMFLFGGEYKGPAVLALDLASNNWSEFATNAPKIHPYYQAAYYSKNKTIYSLSNGSVLYAFNLVDKTWKAMPPASALEGLSWHALACAPETGKLVMVGADKNLDNLGWTRTVVYDLARGEWTTLPAPPSGIVQEHKELAAGIEATIDLVGRTRLAWFRDPKGIGTETELKALIERCGELSKLPAIRNFKSALADSLAALQAQKTLEALKSLRALQHQIEDRAFAQYPVPPSRRNAPLVYDEKNRAFVLFGGDHEDYQMNDTWILDLQKASWHRASLELAPSPRAGHAMVYLPKSGRIALYEGYVASSDPSYAAGPAQIIDPRQLWLYDAKADHWDLVGSWPAKGTPQTAPPSVGAFYGYSSSWFAVPPLAADKEDRLFLAAPARRQEPAATWIFSVDAASLDTAGREKLGQAPNQRRYRDEYFRADYCEVASQPKQLDLATIPGNQWVPFPKPPRQPMSGCRQRDWGTAVWDSDRDQVLFWGGGHCVRSSSVVLHFSPAANRMVEGFDADEPYCPNGMCGPGSSLLNRCWIETHGYNLYAYDPKCHLLVTARGFLYDPERMDWLRMEPFVPPFAYSWGHVVIETSPHGAVAWAKKLNSEDFNLWLFDREKGWIDLEPKGKPRACWCDSDGMVYDAKRDRMLIGWGGGYGKRGDGSITAFDFKTKTLEKITPDNLELGKTSNTREMVYVPEADLVLFGSEPYKFGPASPDSEADSRTAKGLTRVYDCAKKRYFLLDGGPVAYGHSAGWMYDSKRRCAYVINFRGDCWAMRIDPATLALLDKAPSGGTP